MGLVRHTVGSVTFALEPQRAVSVFGVRRKLPSSLVGPPSSTVNPTRCLHARPLRRHGPIRQPACEGFRATDSDLWPLPAFTVQGGGWRAEGGVAAKQGGIESEPGSLSARGAEWGLASRAKRGERGAGAVMGELSEPREARRAARRQGQMQGMSRQGPLLPSLSPIPYRL
jgi:hypothetical protein